MGSTPWKTTKSSGRGRKGKQKDASESAAKETGGSGKAEGFVVYIQSGPIDTADPAEEATKKRIKVEQAEGVESKEEDVEMK